jgi:hypothetical protein
MAVLSFTTPEPVPTRSNQARTIGNNSQNYQDRPKAKLWVNIGRQIGDKFISPFGIPLDNLLPAEIRGQNVDFVKQKTAENQLLEALQKLGMSFTPGQEETLNLEVRIRRTNETIEVKSDENEYSVDINDLLVTSD